MWLVLLAGIGGRAWALDPDKAFEHYVINSWSIQDGLPQISAIAITQDRTGYVWIGTQSGLARFDGVRFATYTPESEPALPGIYIRALATGRDGKVYVGTYKGLTIVEAGRFRAVPLPESLKGATFDVNAIAETTDGTMAVASNAGVFRLEGERLVEWADGPKPAWSLLATDDALYAGGNGMVVRLARDRADAMPLPEALAGASVTRLARAHGRIWAGTTQGLLARADDAWTRYGEDETIGSSPINTLLRDRDDNLWVSTNSGFARLRDGRVAEQVSLANVRATRSVISAFEDREGNLWLGSQLEGIARVWNGWTRRYSTSAGLNDQIVWSLSRAPDGVLWVGGNNGLSTFDGMRFTLVVPGGALPHPHAYNVLAEADRVWIGTRRGLVVLRDGKLESPALYAPMAGAQIQGIRRDRDGDVWIPTTDGLFREHAQTLRRYGIADGLTDVRMRTMLETSTHRLLLGTQGGLFEMRGERIVEVPGLPAGLDVTTISELPSGTLVVGALTEEIFVSSGREWKAIRRNQGLPSNTPFFQTIDGRGYLWIAGIRGVERVPESDLDRFASGAIDTVHGEMLLNERGDRNAGQQGYCCNGAGMSKGFIENGVLWLPSRDGVVALDTRGIAKNEVTPEVAIERVRYLNAWHAVDGDKAIELPADARDLAIDFTAPSFQDPRSILIRYRLLGYDSDWHDLDDVTRRTVNYTNLPHGDYTFVVRATNNAGVFSPETARFPFRIRPWFHETGAFKALVALLLALAIYAGYRYQRRAHEKQRIALEQQVGARTRDLTETLERLRTAQDELVRQEKLASLGGLVAGVAHEINTPLGICVTASSFLQDQLRDWSQAIDSGAVDAHEVKAKLFELEETARLVETNLRRGADLVRSFKQVAVDQSSGLRREFDLAQYLDEIVSSLTPTLTRAHCFVELDCPPDIRMTSYPGALSQVVTNLVMNAVVHAFEGRTGGTILIRARAERDKVTLTVSDDGVGMNEADLKRYFDPFFTTKRSRGGTGLGAHIVFNQVTSVLGGTIRVTSAPGAGLQVEMRLPRAIADPPALAATSAA